MQQHLIRLRRLTYLKAVTLAGRDCRGDELAQDRQSLTSYLNSRYGALLGEVVAQEGHGVYCLASCARGVLQHNEHFISAMNENG